MLISQPISRCLTNHSELCMSCLLNNQPRCISIYRLQRRPYFGFESSVSSTPMTNGDPVLVALTVEGSSDDYRSMTIEKVSEEERSEVEVVKTGRQTVFEERITRVEETEREVIEEKSIRELTTRFHCRVFTDNLSTSRSVSLSCIYSQRRKNPANGDS